uniref:ATP synthase F0 subunit 8 n=1 Tax=Gordionus alpestris TaxID=1137640 RepID=A0A514ABX0_9BILA|nr:ATP synthase F0 subunit 8 [Gordionus alpestris]QDH52422.1 ATP synthase F0 subunit 8 [Gordionus alpestris]
MPHSYPNLLSVSFFFIMLFLVLSSLKFIFTNK